MVFELTAMLISYQILCSTSLYLCEYMAMMGFPILEATPYFQTLNAETPYYNA